MHLPCNANNKSPLVKANTQLHLHYARFAREFCALLLSLSVLTTEQLSCLQVFYHILSQRVTREHSPREGAPPILLASLDKLQFDLVEDLW